MENMKATEIIKQGLAHGESYDLINERLKQAGFDFHLEGNRPEGWTEQEMKEGFQQGEPAPDVKRLHDYMRFNKENAGKTVRVEVPEGTYDVTWNENGNPVSAVRVVK